MDGTGYVDVICGTLTPPHFTHLRLLHVKLWGVFVNVHQITISWQVSAGTTFFSAEGMSLRVVGQWAK